MPISFAAAFFNAVVVFLPDELYSTGSRHALHEYLFLLAESNFNGDNDCAIRPANDYTNQSPRKIEVVVLPATLSAVYLFVDTDNFLGLHTPQRARMGAHSTHALHELRRLCQEKNLQEKIKSPIYRRGFQTVDKKHHSSKISLKKLVPEKHILRASKEVKVTKPIRQGLSEYVYDEY